MNPAAIVNETTYSTDKLTSLVRFAAIKTRHSCQCSVWFVPQSAVENEIVMTSGTAHMFYYPPKTDDPVPSRVVVRLGLHHLFPYTDTYVPLAGAMEIRSQEEEILVVVAHELRHIDQFWGNRGPLEEEEAEFDAETFAHGVLDEWRAVEAEKFVASTKNFETPYQTPLHKAA